MQHPALKKFNTTWEAVKIVGSKALKWGAIGAVALGALAMIPAAPAGLLSLALSLVGVESSMGTAVIVGGLLKGATIGAMLGAVKGVGGVSKALEEKKQDAIADYEQAQVANERIQLMARASGQNMGGGNIAYSSDHVRKLEQQRQQQQDMGQRI